MNYNARLLPYNYNVMKIYEVYKNYLIINIIFVFESNVCVDENNSNLYNINWCVFNLDIKFYK